ncbi:MAG: SpoIIE family protein phosphatase [bacterium]|nr:SpoIIE family protein phosphatase [bacterium]
MADDQPDVLAALRLLLKAEGFRTEAVSSPEAVLASVADASFDLVLMDLNYTRDTTSGQEGIELLSQIQQMERPPAVVVMTAWGSIDLAVEAMRLGARDFVIKPWDNERLATTLRKHLDAAPPETASSHESHDLTIARRVQKKLLAQRFPKLDTLEYSAHCLQAGAVGGDYYDFLNLGDGRVLVVLADVSGKGVPAALLMANLQATLRGLFEREARKDLISLAATVNRLFFESTEPEHFATAFLGIYDDRTRWLQYVNCGHNPPLLVRATEGTERLETTGTVLGAFPFFRTEAGEVSISPGDTLAIFSDGVPEARNLQDEQFGEERLIHALRSHAGAPVADIPNHITDAVAGFSAYGQEDDLTLILARGL